MWMVQWIDGHRRLGMNEALRRRDRNTELGGVVIAALRDEGLSYRDIENATGVPRTVAQRWAVPQKWVGPPPLGSDWGNTPSSAKE
ncbi:MAG: hypothetical protein JOZ09_11570 [Pseudonocardiales bacterium]|nr:hypothetical protein [Pseudonocardiales bacterium]